MKEKRTIGPYRESATMYPIIEAWEKSGQSQHMFSKSRGLSPAVFGYWLRKYREERKFSAGFVAVDLERREESLGSEAFSGKHSGAVFARLCFVDGRELIICEAVSSGYLRALLG